MAVKIHIPTPLRPYVNNQDEVSIDANGSVKNIIDTFNKIIPQKRGSILHSKQDILNFLINDIKNGDYLMIKGSNSTGLNTVAKNLKLGKINAI